MLPWTLAIAGTAADSAWRYANKPPGFFAASDIICSPSDTQNQQKTCSPANTQQNAGCSLTDNKPYCKSQVTCSSARDDMGTIEQGYACPHLMLGTNTMMSARQQWSARVPALEVFGRSVPTSEIEFAIFTFDTFTCGQCALIEPDGAPGTFPRATKLVAQVFNSVAACADVYMAAGGFGAYNGCTNGEPEHPELYHQSQGNKVTYRWPQYCPRDSSPHSPAPRGACWSGGC